jgi:AcrR family transcriptional regulator
MTISNQLQRGRHQLSRDEVRTHQRDRIFGALEVVMAANGYVDTSVADIIKAAGVSRQTFYELFSSKQDCFLAGYARRQDSFIEGIFRTPSSTAPMERFKKLLRAYLEVMARDPALSRLYLIGVYTAGQEAVTKRFELQQQFVDAIVRVFEAQTEKDRFVCRALTASISMMVTSAVLDDDSDAVMNLYQPLVDVAARLMVAE